MLDCLGDVEVAPGAGHPVRALLEERVAAETVAEVVVLPELPGGGGAVGDCVSVDEDFDGANVAGEVAGVVVGLGERVRGDLGVVLGRFRAAVFSMRVIGVPPAIGRDGRGFSWREVVVFVPCLIRHQRGAELAAITLGHPLLDEYLAFVAARARINTWLAVASDLKIFFGVVAKEPAEVTAADVFAFLAEQRKPRLGDRVVRLEDGEAGLAARTIARRLSSVRGLYAYLTARGDTGVTRNPVPTSLAARRRGARRGHGGVPLIRTPRTLPRVLSPVAVDALVGAVVVDAAATFAGVAFTTRRG